MADEENTEDIAEDDAKSGGKGKMIMFGGIGLVLVAVGVFAGPMIMNMISPPEADESAEEAEPPNDPALYTSLHPPLVVNFKDEFGDAHFMQITMEVMSRDQVALNTLRENVAVIRNSLILLYSSAIYEDVVTREGKEKMLSDGLAEIQSIMTELTGEPSIEAVYFTGLVIQ